MDERSILSKLFCGEINPSNRTTENMVDYGQKLDELIELDNKFRESLNHEQAELYDRCKDLQRITDSMESEENFRYGFRLGMLIALEVNQISDKFMGDVVLSPTFFESEVSDLEV